MFAKAVFTLGAWVWYSLGSNVTTQFFQIPIPEIGHSAGAQVQGQDQCTQAQKWATGPCVHIVLVSSGAVYFLLENWDLFRSCLVVLMDQFHFNILNSYLSLRFEGVKKKNSFNF